MVFVIGFFFIVAFWWLSFLTIKNNQASKRNEILERRHLYYMNMIKRLKYGKGTETQRTETETPDKTG